MFLIKLNIILSTIYFTKAFVSFNDNEYLFKDLERKKSSNRYYVNYLIEQPLDHFNNSDKRTWKMRYFKGLDFWKERSPIYLFIGGNTEANPTVIDYGIMHELAEETNGAMFVSEQRYYGGSKPFRKFDENNLVHLNSRQALEDIATLIKYIKSSSQFASSKVVVFGSGTGGNLAAWMRKVHPELVDAALSSSAPVLAKKDFYESYETAGKVFREYGGDDCYNKIAKRFKRYHELFQTSAGIAQLKKEERICNNTDMTVNENKYLFFDLKASPFLRVAKRKTPEYVKDVCDDLFVNSHHNIRSQKSLFENPVWNNYNGNKWCYDYNLSDQIDFIRETRNHFVPWYYQTCTEFGYFETTSSDKHPFTNNIPIDMFTYICTRMFGSEFNEERVNNGVKITNDMYGGLTPNVTKVVFVNGDMDPWHHLGVLKDLSDDAPAILVHGTSRSTELPPESEVPEQMKETRKYVKTIIKKWIGV